MGRRTKSITLVLMGVCAAVLIGWDIVAAVNQTPGDTISELTQGFFIKYLGPGIVLIWAWGFVFGHLFWPQIRRVDSRRR